MAGSKKKYTNLLTAWEIEKKKDRFFSSSFSLDFFFLRHLVVSRLSPCLVNNTLNQCRLWGTKTRKYILRHSSHLSSLVVRFFFCSLLSLISRNLMRPLSFCFILTHGIILLLYTSSASICLVYWIQRWIKCRQMSQVNGDNE
jgi:hypothetical protein